MSKVQNNKQHKKDSLLNNAFTLFTEKGLNKTTISDIAEKAGVAKGTFYLYFKDKYDIRNRLIANKSAELFSRAYNNLQSDHYRHQRKIPRLPQFGRRRMKHHTKIHRKKLLSRFTRCVNGKTPACTFRGRISDRRQRPCLSSLRLL